MRGKKTKGYITLEVDTDWIRAETRALKAEVSRKASMANKRLKRLEQKGLTSAPAYKQWFESGGHKFSVRGKSYNELQAELARVNHFINAKTSTIRGVNNTLREIAKTTGIETKDIVKIQNHAVKFFELTSKIEQYLRNTEDSASAIGYRKIFEVVSNYVKQEKIDLGKSEQDVDAMMPNLVGMITRAVDAQIYEDMFKAF